MKRTSSVRSRRLTFEYWRTPDNKLICQGKDCGAIIDPVRDRWEADHEIPVWMGGADEPPNLRPLCYRCHREKTKSDVKAIAKSKRVRDRHFGVRVSKRPMPCGRNSRWKKKLDGTVVLR